MATPDNRIRFPASIDFDTQVGTTGQDHDNYPSPNTQARYDWMRIFLIGLLSNQSSYDAPTQYRDGTIWFDLNTLQFKVYAGGQWVPLAQAIKVIEPIPGNPTNTVNLQDVFDRLKALEARVTQMGG